ncbi:EamA family transporter [Streptococcaceae bacterium ESL0687]|nr:EamA family transporter [Streptococcaceae bacterium ESL0687]
MVNENKRIVGYLLVLLAALASSLGQLAWKLGAESTSGLQATLMTVLGFVLAGAGMIVLMASFRYGEVSILQPMMSIGFAFSVFFGYLFLGESISLNKILGVLFIVAGAFTLAYIPKKEREIGK